MVEALIIFFEREFIKILTVFILFIALIYIIRLTRDGEFLIFKYTYITGFILFILFNIGLIYKGILNEFMFRVGAYSLLLSSGLIILILLLTSKTKIMGAVNSKKW